MKKYSLFYSFSMSRTRTDYTIQEDGFDDMAEAVKQYTQRCAEFSSVVLYDTEKEEIIRQFRYGDCFIK